MLSRQKKTLTKSQVKIHHHTNDIKRSQAVLPNSTLAGVNRFLSDRWNGTGNTSLYTQNEDTVNLNPFTARDLNKPHVETIFAEYELEEYEKVDSKNSSMDLDISTLDIESQSQSRSSNVNAIHLVRSKPDDKGKTWSIRGVKDEKPILDSDGFAPILTDKPTTSDDPSNEDNENNVNLPRENVLKKQRSRMSQTSSTGPGRTKRFVKLFKDLFRSKTKTSGDHNPTSPPETEAFTPEFKPTPQIEPFLTPPTVSSSTKDEGYRTSGSESEEQPTMTRERTPPSFTFDKAAYNRWEHDLKKEEVELKAEAKAEQALKDDFPLMYAVAIGDIGKEDEERKAVDDVTAAIIEIALATGSEKEEERIARMRRSDARKLDIMFPPLEVGYITLPPPPDADGCASRSLAEDVSDGQDCSCMHECLCPWDGSDQSEDEEEDREPDMDAISRFVDALTGNWGWGDFEKVGIKSYCTLEKESF